MTIIALLLGVVILATGAVTGQHADTPRSRGVAAAMAAAGGCMLGATTVLMQWQP